MNNAAAKAAAKPTPRNLANAIRALSMDAVERAKSGHPGMPMGMADAATVLFTEFLKFDVTKPGWPDRDRFVLSAGHGSMLQYSLHYLLGYADMTLDEIKNFRQWGAKTAGHPEFGHALGVETTTGPLGQGLGNAVGMALAERMLNARYGDDLVNHYTYSIAGDGCLMEGISQESITFAGHLKLHKLIVLFDDNGISIDGPTSLSTSEDTKKRFEAAGWDVQQIDGHDADAVRKAITAAQKTGTPSLIACKTTIGYGAPKKAGTSGSHGSPLGAEEILGTRTALEWAHKEFDVPSDVMDEWRAAGTRSRSEFDAWTKRLDASDKRGEFERVMRGDLPSDWLAKLNAFKKDIIAAQPNEATRKSSENALGILTAAIPEMVGGSADLTGSNNTKTKAMQAVQAGQYGGTYIYYGIREHGMAAAMNGMALHGGLIPYGGTFLVFTDYCRPSIRLAALMKQRVIYVMTHDSIGLGEDGPTHQPVEHLASLRAIPDLRVMRPADAVETAECWALALQHQGPTILSLTRQNLPTTRKEYSDANACARGAYFVSQKANAKGVIIATGSEVEIALEAQAKLAGEGIEISVVSMPSWELFAKQPETYRKEILGSGVRVAIEAASGFGWERWLGDNGIFIGMKGFGASAPAPELYKRFGITADAAVAAVKAKLK